MFLDFIVFLLHIFLPTKVYSIDFPGMSNLRTAVI